MEEGFCWGSFFFGWNFCQQKNQNIKLKRARDENTLGSTKTLLACHFLWEAASKEQVFYRSQLDLKSRNERTFKNTTNWVMK